MSKNKPTLPSAVPSIVDDYGSIHPRHRQLYERGSNGFVRNAAGDALADYRTKRAADPLAEPATKRRAMTKQQWSLLLAVCQPGAEREHFMRAAATKIIEVKG